MNTLPRLVPLLPIVLGSLVVLATGARPAAAPAWLTNPQPASSTLHIMIDPGHGGSDNGATRGKLKEKEIALKVSLLLADLLRDDPRFKVSMTRTTDIKLALPERVKMAEKAKVDLYVSIHLNSSSDPRARGTEIYFQNQLPADEEALFLLSHEGESEEPSGSLPAAQKEEPLSPRSDLRRIVEDLHRNHRILVSSELSKTLFETLVERGATDRLGSRAIRQAPFHVVTYTTIPSVLVEIGFLSHAQEGPRLAKGSYQKELAASLAQGLIKYRDSLDRPVRVRQAETIVPASRAASTQADRASSEGVGSD